MSKPNIDSRKIVVLSGAGVSAASGLATFRASGGLWEQHRIEDIATPNGWAVNSRLVLDFYNKRRFDLSEAAPNAAHLAIASLEEFFDVVVITQNVDDLHERAGSKKVIHLHGELTKARSSVDDSLIYDVGYESISLGELCDRGSQLRPHIVWFGESVLRLDEARCHIREAGKFVVIGTSLSVFPAAGLVKHARFHAEKILVDLDSMRAPFGFRPMRGSAEVILPLLAKKWRSEVG